MNKINLVINMQIDFLQFSNFNSFISKSIVLLSSHRIILKQKSLTSTHILKRSTTFITSSFSQFKEKSVEQSKLLDAVLPSVNFKSTFSLKSASSSMNISMIKAAVYRMLVKRSDIKIFAVIVLKID